MSYRNTLRGIQSTQTKRNNNSANSIENSIFIRTVINLYICYICTIKYPLRPSSGTKTKNANNLKAQTISINYCFAFIQTMLIVPLVQRDSHVNACKHIIKNINAKRQQINIISNENVYIVLLCEY